MKYSCSACGYIYDEDLEGTAFEDLPEDWTCPECGAPKEAFEEVIEEESKLEEEVDNDSEDDLE